MEIRQLEALVSIADHGTFSAAAEVLGTVQSNISIRIARLESELGTGTTARLTFPPDRWMNAPGRALAANQ